MTDSELDDLSNLVKSPGWQRWCQWAVGDAQSNVEQEMARALENDNDQVAAGRMRQAIAGKRALERAIRRPDERIRELSPILAPEGPVLPPSRRGSL